MSTLILDPAFNVDPPIMLDPSLEPAFPFSTQYESEMEAGSWSQPQDQHPLTFESINHVSAYPSPSHTPAPEAEKRNKHVTTSNTTCRRGKNADELAIQEAKKLVGQHKSCR